jgi:hypothetical protein
LYSEEISYDTLSSQLVLRRIFDGCIDIKMDRWVMLIIMMKRANFIVFPAEIYLYIAMKYMCRMDVVEAFKDLIDEVLNVVDIQRLLAIDDTMKIGIH